MRTLPDLLARIEARGGSPFLGAADTTLSGAGFAARARALARGMQAAGVVPGQRVAIYLEKRVEKALAVFAAALTGAISVVVNQKLKDAQLQQIVGDCTPGLCVTSQAKLALLEDPAALRASVRLLDVDQPLPAAAAVPGPWPLLAPADPATLLYTSGSTGPPKGIIQSHGSLHDGARIVAGYLGLTPKDHLLGILPLSFDYGLNQVLGAAYAGSRITLLQYFALPEVFAALAALPATGLAGVPVFWSAFASALRTGQADPGTLHALRYVTNSGGRLVVADIQTLRAHLPWVAVFSMYGLTEAFRSAYLPPELIDTRPLSIGRAVPEVELLVVDPETGRECDSGEVGELVHTGALLADGYWNRPADTAAVFRPDPRDPTQRAVWSGDLGRRDADGLLYFVGRRDRQLKVSGYRVSPDEVEQHLRTIGGVGLAAVFGVPDAVAGHRLVACVVPGPDAPGDLAAAVARSCRRTLPHFLVPAEIHVVVSPPLNANGKIDVPALARALGHA